MVLPVKAVLQKISQKVNIIYGREITQTEYRRDNGKIVLVQSVKDSNVIMVIGLNHGGKYDKK